ncbi:MAG: shikimate kinase [Methanomicrobiales archaeon]|jgi:shikimate kinase|nr:shikimate kinase [Methanomicrobiales archaeon]
MTELKGFGSCMGAATVVNAIATGKGAAFGIDLKTEAYVTLRKDEGVNVTIDGHPSEDTLLAKRCVINVLDTYSDRAYRGADVRTFSEIPISKGLKSSSSAANAIVAATLDALCCNGDNVDKKEILFIGVQSAKEAKVTITGAFDDAAASLLGGLVITDNTKNEIIKRTLMPEDLKVLIHVPDFSIRKRDVPVDRVKECYQESEIALQMALEGDFAKAMKMNGKTQEKAMNLSGDVSDMAMKCGALSAGLSGTGPATVILVKENDVKRFQSCFCDNLIIADIYNGTVE